MSSRPGDLPLQPPERTRSLESRANFWQVQLTTATMMCVAQPPAPAGVPSSPAADDRFRSPAGTLQRRGGAGAAGAGALPTVPVSTDAQEVDGATSPSASVLAVRAAASPGSPSAASSSHGPVTAWVNQLVWDGDVISCSTKNGAVWILEWEPVRSD